MSHCQLEPNILSFEVPYSEGVTAHRKGRDCLDCQRIWKGDKDLPVNICLQLSFFPILHNHTHKASVGHITIPSPSVIIVFFVFFFFIDCTKSKKKRWSKKPLLQYLQKQSPRAVYAFGFT